MSRIAVPAARTVLAIARRLTRAGVALGLAVTAIGAEAASQVPAQRFDLSHWALTLPVDSSGGILGAAMNVTAAQLADGYTSQWFYTGSDGGVSFYVPATGALTDTASSPRSELREQIQPPSNSVNWYTNTQSYLDATVAVNKIPSSSGKVIIGQVHPTDGDPMLKIYFKADSATSTSGDVYGQLLLSPNGAAKYSTWLLAKNVPLNKQFTYNMSVIKGVVKMSVNGGAVASKTISSVWSSSPMYFKAGAYPHSSGKTGDDSKVTFYSALVTHK